MSEVAARFFDGESARQHDVVVRIGPENLEVRDEAGAVLAVWPADEVRLIDRADGKRPLRLGLTQRAARIVIADPSCLDVLQRYCPNLKKRGPGIREIWRPIILWTGGAVAALVFLFWVAIPFGARQVADAIPPEIEERLGAAVVERVARIFARGDAPRFCATPAGDAALARLVDRLSDEVDLPYPLTVRVVDHPMNNAFTLPGGQIVLFRGLLEFANSAEEVAGILAHEIGHAQRRHPMEVFIKNAGAAVLVGFLLGDVTGGTIIVAISQATVTAAYSREAEREADADAVVLLNGAGIDGTAFAEFFERVRRTEPSQLDDVMSVIGTHPATQERLEFVRARARADGAALSQAQWLALKGICGED